MTTYLQCIVKRIENISVAGTSIAKNVKNPRVDFVLN